MIRSIEISGLGPHTHTHLDFPGPAVEVAGPSEVGKSMLGEALAFVLWGLDGGGKPFPVEAISDDADAAEVTLTLTSGTVLGRRIDRKRRISRSVHTPDGHTEGYQTEDAYRDALARLGQDVDLLRLVMFPFSWVRLADGEGGGRPLRDHLLRMLPKADIRTEVARLMEAAGYELSDRDPLNEQAALTLRRDTRRKRDNVEGRVESLREGQAVIQAETTADVDETAVSMARDTVVRAEAWAAYAKACEGRAAALRRAAHVDQDVAAWKRRRDELGEPPAAPDVDMGALREAERKASTEHEEARRALTAAQAKAVEAAHAADAGRESDEAVVAARMALDDAQCALEDAKGRKEACEDAPDACPTCNRPGWDRSDEFARLRAAVSAAEDDVDRAAKALTAARRSATARIKREADEAKTDESAARRRLAAAADVLEAARLNLHAAEEAVQAANTWRSKRDALGPEPTKEPIPPEPERPATGPVSDEDAAAARRALEQERKAKAKASQRHEDLERITAQLRQSEELLAALGAECARLDALVDAVRVAPGRAAERQLLALGDISPARIQFGGAKDACTVEIFCGGAWRPWRLASTGRRIVADARLRAGMRRALPATLEPDAPRGLSWLPIIIDRVQDVEGQPLPDVAAPVIHLRTTDGEGLSVRPLIPKAMRTDAAA